MIGVTGNCMVLVVDRHNLPKPCADLTRTMMLPRLKLSLDRFQLRGHPLLRRNAPDVKALKVPLLVRFSTKMRESLLLALSGGVLGLLLAYVSVHWIRVLGPQSVPRVGDVGIDGTALLLTFTISVVLAVLFGMAPVGRASGIDVQNTLQDTSRTSAGVGAVWGRGHSLRHLLVVAELALCTMLLIGSGLLVRSFLRARDVPPGFNPRNVLTMESP